MVNCFFEDDGEGESKLNEYCAENARLLPRTQLKHTVARSETTLISGKLDL
jgi:hypothetical protein